MTDSLATQTIQDRLDRLKELTEFTENCKEKLNNILQTLGWSSDFKGSSQEPMEQCPYDPNHWVPIRTMEKHTASCKLRKLGYSQEEQAEMYDPTVCYENTSVRSVTMDKDTQHQVILQARSAAPLMRMEGVFWQGQYSSQPIEVPQNHKRAVCDLTVADRLALYNHVTKVISQQQEDAASTNNEDLFVDLVAKLKKDEGQNEPKSHLELMAEMRDYKRRRQSYRAKNVHITKKSYTEVIREVIEVHSGELAKQWKEEEKEEEEERRAGLHSQSQRPDDQHSALTESHGSDHLDKHGSRNRSYRSSEHSQDKKSRKKKKKRKRDSRSPDGCHDE